ncbi:MAG TPA: DUF3617 family protein [Rhizomicrobium sp.]|nr:DUF3617 family protein [Rhizomicrobium sp.]
MKLELAAAAALAALMAVPSQAADFIHRKAGFWTITMHMDGVKNMPASTRMCLDANTDQKMMDHSMAWQPKECSPPSIQGMGPSRTVDVVCHMDGGVQKTHVVMTFVGDNAYHMDISTTNTPPRYGRAGMHMTQDAKWQGACPADFKPGDMEVSGMKINVLNGPGGMSGGHLTKAQIEAIIKAHQH